MKLRQIGRAALAGAVSVGMVIGITACGRDNTIDYLFVANSKNNPGQIGVYLVDSQSGVLTQIVNSPYPSGGSGNGRNPISLKTSPNEKYLYALNHDDNTIVKFNIGTDAKLYPENTYNTPGSNPTSMAVNSAGTYLYVTDAFQPQYNATSPGPGQLVVYPIKSDGTLGTPAVYPVCNNPVDVNVLSNNTTVYVVNDPGGQPPKLADTTASSAVGANGTATITYTATGSCFADSGQINAFTVGSNGTLSQIANSPFAAGTTPVAIASDPLSRFVYVTDLVTNQLLAYTTSGNGGLTPINTGPFPTGAYPDAVTVDPRGQYLYVANYNAGTISAYAIAEGTGVPSTLSGTGAYGVSTGPTFVFIEPNAGKYVYTADFLDNTVYGSALNASTGVLSTIQNDPFPAAGQPTAIAGVTHGRHPVETPIN